jgi:hypothetical protein
MRNRTILNFARGWTRSPGSVLKQAVLLPLSIVGNGERMNCQKLDIMNPRPVGGFRSSWAKMTEPRFAPSRPLPD